MVHPYQIFDVFTDAPLSGNPLGVVFDADDLTTEDMQRIAREFNLSETVFFLTPADPAFTARMRIFTPVSEMPFAGHPTIGGTIAMALSRGDHDDIVCLELNAGPIAATVEALKTGGLSAFDAPIVPSVLPQPVDADAVVAALSLQPGDLGFDGLVPVQATSGPKFTMVPVADVSVLSRIECDRRVWRQAFAPPMSAAFCVTRTGPASFQARMFSPFEGIEEDPATGSAAVAFAALLAPLAGRDGVHSVTIAQGIEMERASRIGLDLEITDGALSRVRLSGRAVKVCEGTLFV